MTCFGFVYAVQTWLLVAHCVLLTGLLVAHFVLLTGLLVAHFVLLTGLQVAHCAIQTGQSTGTARQTGVSKDLPAGLNTQTWRSRE